MSQHTPEPWRLKGTDILTGKLPVKGPYPLVDAIGTPISSIYRLEDARRIVACVNACAGISTAQLQKVYLKPLLEEIDGFIPFLPPASVTGLAASIAGAEATIRQLLDK